MLLSPKSTEGEILHYWSEYFNGHCDRNIRVDDLRSSFDTFVKAQQEQTNSDDQSSRKRKDAGSADSTTVSKKKKRQRKLEDRSLAMLVKDTKTVVAGATSSNEKTTRIHSLLGRKSNPQVEIVLAQVDSIVHMEPLVLKSYSGYKRTIEKYATKGCLHLLKDIPSVLSDEDLHKLKDISLDLCKKQDQLIDKDVEQAFQFYMDNRKSQKWVAVYKAVRNDIGKVDGNELIRKLVKWDSV